MKSFKYLFHNIVHGRGEGAGVTGKWRYISANKRFTTVSQFYVSV